VRVVSLHADVLLATSAIWQTNCVIVRGTTRRDKDPVAVRLVEDPQPGAETFVIDSPVLPEELDVLPALLEQSHFPAPSGLLVTHADWDHMLGRIAFPDATLGCATATAERMRSAPGQPQRELRTFDEAYYVQRPRPLALGAVQALDVPGGCEIGCQELALFPAEGHTVDGMAVSIAWAQILVVGDYLSSIEIPMLADGGSIDAYLDTLERLRPLISEADHVVPGHGPVLDSKRAAAVLEEDRAYLCALRDNGAANLPDGRRTQAQRRIHSQNLDRAAS
jgi:glyoxylase-like metal-dependent hydrolase (beta-lactamase superfamily II)